MGCPMSQFIYREIRYWTYHGRIWYMYGMHHGPSRGLSREVVSVHGNEPMGRPMEWVVFHGPSHGPPHGMASKPWAFPWVSHGTSLETTHGQRFILWYDSSEGLWHGHNDMGRPMGCPMGWFTSHRICHWTSHGTVLYEWDAPWAAPWVVPRNGYRPMGPPMGRTGRPVRDIAAHGKSHGNGPMGHLTGWVVSHGPTYPPFHGMVYHPSAFPWVFPWDATHPMGDIMGQPMCSISCYGCTIKRPMGYPVRS